MRQARQDVFNILQVRKEQDDGSLQDHLGLCNGDDVDGDHDDDGVEQINIEISFFSAAAGLLCAAMG